ncbi:MAG: hypothetical protein ACRD0X_08295, partial [Thermoanaerobaculia bacterium]
LLAWLGERRGRTRDHVIAESRVAVAVRTADWKLFVRREDGRSELYDLRSDPGEQREVAAERPAEVARLRSLLAAWRRDLEVYEPVQQAIDVDTRKALAALGYLDD